jgi:hypothetical protein
LVGRLIALTLALLAGALIAWSQHRPSPVAPSSAAPQAFSAARAMETVRAIAPTPHPMGSEANHQVRDMLLARMTALGLSPRLRQGDILAPPREGGVSGATPQSLIGVLPGRDRAAPAVALMAHYDSRNGAPGAADDGAGVAVVLESIRAIRARGTPARDVVVILTDGEEACLCGAREVFAHDPIVRHIGLLVNLDARGSGGRTLMFETGAGDGQAMRLFRDAAVRPLAGSLFSAVYAILPSDTDFSVARKAGLAGFNFAFTGRTFDYHAPTDTPDHLEGAALQDMGDQVLATAAAAAVAPRLPGSAPDAVYGVVFGRWMILYPPVWGWAPLAAAAALLALALWRTRRREGMPWMDVARGVGAGLFTLACAAAFLHLAGVAAVAFAAQGTRRLLAEAARFEFALMLVAVGALLFAAAETARGRRGPGALLPLLAGLASCALIGGLDRVGLAEGVAAALLALALGRGPISRPGAWGGVLLLGLGVGVAAQIAAPLAAYVIVWPLLAGALAAAATDLAADKRTDRLAALTLVALLVVGWAGVHAHLVVVVTGLPELLVLPVFMAALALWPLAQPDAGAPPARLPGRALLVAGAALVLLVRLSGAWDERHPQASLVAYLLDQDAGRAWRVAPPTLRTGWSDAVLRADGGRLQRLSLWSWGPPVDAAPARLAAIPAPTITSVRRADGLLVITLRPPAGVRALSLQLSPDTPAKLEGVGAAPASLRLAPGRWTEVTWTVPPPAGLTLDVRPAGPGALQLRYSLTRDGWPPGVTPPPRPPADVMGVEFSGDTLITGSRRVTW